MQSHYSPANLPSRLAQERAEHVAQIQRLLSCSATHAQKIFQNHAERTLGLWRSGLATQQGLVQSLQDGKLLADSAQYLIDAAQRSALTVDVLRERANNDKLHEEAGTPPVLDYDYELVLDARHFARPANYQLLKILHPEGGEISDRKRPFMIIDPRAGHGAGIGGFKPDSQVGVALRGGHPVYFVVFRQHPEPGQTLADVMRAEAEFLREISRRHPDAPNPIVVGNCQGGWATLVLAAANPDITGPLVINGSPVSTWSGQVGANPMRYNGGLMGGIAPALLSMDLANGEFDGAHLVSNFEQLNPSRNFFGKYYDLYANVDKGRESFLEFERWWGGFHFLNESEMRWIVEQIFIGNKLSRGEAELEPGRHLDLKFIRSPIVVFASKGDNITPPQQALNWIVDTYSDENEIRIRGQRIVYMVHEKVGHLGIFVSSSIARKEHTEVTSTLQTLEALAPGLYEMKIDHSEGEGADERFVVSFHDRKMSDILEVVPNDRELERGFGAVARLSRLGADLYEMTARPLVQSMVTEQSAELLRDMNSSRVSRRIFSDQNPVMAAVGVLAGQAREQRQPVAAGNPWLVWQETLADGISQGMDLYRDLRDSAYEMSFLSIYGAPWMNWFGQSLAQQRTHKKPEELRWLPTVQATLEAIDEGGYEAAVVRMLVLLADSRGSVRRDRLERSAQVLTTEPPFAQLSAQRRAALIHEQSVIVEFEPEQALRSLVRLLPLPEQRHQAFESVRFVVGDRSDMEPHSLHMFEAMEQLLGQVQTPALASLSPQDEPAPQLASDEADAASAAEVSAADSQPGAKPARKTAARNKPQE